MDYVKNRFIREERTGVALDKHMMHVTISYPLPDNRLLTQLFTIRRRFSKCGYDIPNS